MQERTNSQMSRIPSPKKPNRSIQANIAMSISLMPNFMKKEYMMQSVSRPAQEMSALAFLAPRHSRIPVGSQRRR